MQNVCVGVCVHACLSCCGHFTLSSCGSRISAVHLAACVHLCTYFCVCECLQSEGNCTAWADAHLSARRVPLYACLRSTVQMTGLTPVSSKLPSVCNQPSGHVLGWEIFLLGTLNYCEEIKTATCDLLQRPVIQSRGEIKPLMD